MKVKLILPALAEATSPYFRPIKYSLFPPLGLATLAAYLGDDDEAWIVDEHVEPNPVDDHPDLVVIQVYITNAKRGSVGQPAVCRRPLRRHEGACRGCGRPPPPSMASSVET